MMKQRIYYFLILFLILNGFINYIKAQTTVIDSITKEITDVLSLQNNFITKATDCKTALASIENKKRIILYNQDFIEKVHLDINYKWAIYGVIAHEIGHHLNNDDFETIDYKQRKQRELDADLFSGKILNLLGATLEESKLSIAYFSLEGSSKTHPPPSARLEAVTNGWMNQKDKNDKQESIEIDLTRFKDSLTERRLVGTWLEIKESYINQTDPFPKLKLLNIEEKWFFDSTMQWHYSYMSNSKSNDDFEKKGTWQIKNSILEINEKTPVKEHSSYDIECIDYISFIATDKFFKIKKIFKKML